MLPTWGYYVNDQPTVTANNARIYGKWLGARFKNAPNIVWVNGGDRVATGFEEVYRELAHGLREGDGGAHLITYHPCGWRSSSQYFHSDEWLGFNMIETWTEWSKIYSAVVSDSLLTPRKPVVLGEGAYENGPEYPQGPITPLIVRRQAWWSVMAGGFHTYGQNQMWRMESGWDSTFDTPGAEQVTKMKEIVTSLPWWDMVPDQGLFATGIGVEPVVHWLAPAHWNVLCDDRHLGAAGVACLPQLVHECLQLRNDLCVGSEKWVAIHMLPRLERNRGRAELLLAHRRGT